MFALLVLYFVLPINASYFVLCFVLSLCIWRGFQKSKLVVWIDGLGI